MAPANVLHGAVRLQGLASSPTPDTQVRLACAKAKLLVNTNSPRAIEQIFNVFIELSLFVSLLVKQNCL
jgi:hypothetical protein